ncbi:hypothetical protein [Brevibacillus sp. JB24b]|uniref:hypothetical protein n=1 Tax=Brevibacillus sp. JB24b TaxID=3422308 RepID=UPI003F689717
MAKKKWRKYKAHITQKAYERLSKQVDDIFEVELPDIRKKIQEATGDERERLEKEKIDLLRSVLRYNKQRNYAHLIPELNEQPQVSVHTNKAFCDVDTSWYYFGGYGVKIESEYKYYVTFVFKSRFSAIFGHYQRLAFF